ncbi:MAG: response regulator transcription factor [Myxococcota bacterium]
MTPIRVAVADHHPVVRKGLEVVMGDRPDLAIVGTAVDRQSAIDLCRKESPEVLLTGISLPGPSIFEMLQVLRREKSPTQVLVFSGRSEEDYALSCMDAGAAGFVSKEQSPEEILDAVTKVAAGQRVVSAAVSAQLAARVLGGSEDPVAHQRLSTREFEVFLLLGSGNSVGVIARRLGISPKTVSTHRANICEKTGLATNAEIIRYVVARELA